MTHRFWGHLNESHHTYEWDVNDAFLSHEWVTLPMRMCHITRMKGDVHDMTWLIHMCDMTHSHVWHDSFTCVTWLIHMCEMTDSRVWHELFTCVTWLIHMCTCVTWLIHMCDMTHSRVWHVWHDSFTCVTWLIHTCDMTHSCDTWRNRTCDMTHRFWGVSSGCSPQRDMTHSHVTWLDLTWIILCMTWLSHTCDTSPRSWGAIWGQSRGVLYNVIWHIHMWYDLFSHDSFICMTWLSHTCDMTHRSWGTSSGVFSTTWHDSFMYDTWLLHVWHDSMILVTWLAGPGGIWRVLLISRTWKSHVSYINVNHWKYASDWCIFPTWHICMCAITQHTRDSQVFEASEGCWPCVRDKTWVMRDMCDTWLIRICYHVWHMTESYFHHDTFIYVTWLNHMTDSYFVCDLTDSYLLTLCDMTVMTDSYLLTMCDMTVMTDSYFSHDTWVMTEFVTCATWLIRDICDMVDSYLLTMCDTWLILILQPRHIHSCDMTPSHDAWLLHVWHDWIILVPWRTGPSSILKGVARSSTSRSDMTHSYVWRDSFKRDTWLIPVPTYDSIIRVTGLIHTWQVTHSLWHYWIVCVPYLGGVLGVYVFTQ